MNARLLQTAYITVYVMFQLAALLSSRALDISGKMNGSGCIMLAFNWIPNRLKSHYNKSKCNTKYYKVVQWIHSYYTFFSLISPFLSITPTSFFLISNSMPSVIYLSLQWVDDEETSILEYRTDHKKQTTPHPSFSYTFPLHFHIFLLHHSASCETAPFLCIFFL